MHYNNFGHFWKLVLHGSVATQLERGENDHIIANCLQSAPVKEFSKLANYRRKYWQK